MSGLQHRLDLVAIQICNDKGLRLTDHFTKMKQIVKDKYYSASQEEREALVEEWDQMGI